MAYLVINLTHKIDNVSCQVGDTVYKSMAPVQIAGFNTVNANFTRIGEISYFLPNSNGQLTMIVVEVIGTTADALALAPNTGEFLTFRKDPRVNISSIQGHYLEVEFKNSSIDEADLFSVSSEVSVSSK